MRIMLIAGKYPPQQCGIGDYTHRLARELGGCGHQISILTSTSAEGESDVHRIQGNLKIIRGVPRWDSRIFAIVLNHMRLNKVELVHIQFDAYSFSCHPLVTLLPLFFKTSIRWDRPKVVVTFHEMAGPSSVVFPGPARRAWLLPLMFFSDAIVLTNERHMSHMRNVPLLRSKIHLIPLGSNIERKDKAKIDISVVKRKLGVADDELLLVRFGFIDRFRLRQLDTLLAALKHVSAKGHKVKMLFVGAIHPDAQAGMIELARSMALEARVLWTGFSPAEDVSAYLSSADIGVFPYPDGVSEKRGTLLAAMCHGLPLVTTHKGHVSSMFIQRENILLVPVGDHKQMAEAIEELIVDEELRNRLSGNAVKAVEGCNWEAIGKKTDELYRLLVSEPSKNVMSKC